MCRGTFSGSEDWKKEGITLAPNTTVDPHAPSLAEFNAAFSIVFVDPTGYVNLVSDMNRGVFDQVSTIVNILFMAPRMVYYSIINLL